MAQNNISGRVLEKTESKPLKGVTITVINQSNNNKVSTVTNEIGLFTIVNLPQGEYAINTNFIGYKSEEKIFNTQNKNIEFSFTLAPSNLIIEEVEIQNSKAVQVQGDTLEFNANNFSTREYADADELVAQIPGIIIDEEGNVSAHGEKVTRIIVDGKEFFSSDPRVALKTLPADIIAKIQLIDEKSEEAKFTGVDDGKRNKIINIVTKKDKRKGNFGKSNVGLGNDKYTGNVALNGFDEEKKYAINLMANNINETNFEELGRGGIRRGNSNTDRGLSKTYAVAANYTNSFLDKKMDFSADYNYSSINTATDINSDIEYLSQKQENQFRTQIQATDLTTREHKLNSRVKWNINPKNRLDFSPNIRFTERISQNHTDFETSLSKNTLLNSSNRFNENNNQQINFGGSLTFMHRFNKKGRALTLSLNGNHNSNDANGLNLAMTSYFKGGSLSRIDTNNNKSLTNEYGSSINSKLSFTETISSKSRLKANYSFRNTASYSDKETFEFLAETGQLGDLKDRLSNEFRNDYNYHSGGITYLYNNKDSLRLQIGANYQHGVRINNRMVPIHMKTTANFNSILPDLAFVYKMSKNRVMEFNYNTQTNTPTIGQLQDFVNNQNELRITNGNPNLNQEYKHAFRFQYKDINSATARSLTTNISVELINNKIVNSILMTDTALMLFDDIKLGAGGQFIVPINVNGSYSVRINNSYGIPIKKLKTNFQSNTRLYFNNEIAQINESLTNSHSYGFGQTFGLNSNFNKKYIIGLSYTIDGRVTQNPIGNIERYKIFNHRINNNNTIQVADRIVVNSNMMYIFNGGIMNGPSVESLIWSASIGYKLLKRKNAEISLKGIDLLNNSKNVNRRVNETSISNIISSTLTRYFLVSFTYNLRNFR